MTARRLAAPFVLAAEAAALVASPVLGLLAAAASPLTGGRRPLRLLYVALVYAVRHLGATAACAWLAATGRAASREAHYAVMRWFVGGVYDAVVRAARVHVRVEGSGDAERVLCDRRIPVVVLSMHAGEGDTLLVVHRLLCRYGRRPRIVMHERLALDPLVAALGRRLPNRFVDPRGGDTEVEIAAMARDAGGDDAVLIFPEGKNFSEAHRRHAIERLERAGHDEEAGWARGMRHVSAPRPGGALAAVDAAPAADVVFVAYAGVPRGFGELWRRLPERQDVAVRLWHAPRAGIPAGHDARIDWLFSWWRTLDAWVAGT